MNDILPAMVFPLLMIVAGVGDVLTLRIPNWLNLLIAALFPIFALSAGMPWDVIGVHAATGFGMLVLGALLFGFGVFGGGDAKLLAAASLWVGFEELMPFLVFTALAGGVLALWVVAARFAGGGKMGDGRPGVPYGFAIAAGAILAVS